jgi:hypothetical protein
MSHFDTDYFTTRTKKQHPFLRASPPRALQARAGRLRTCLGKEKPAAAPDSKKKCRAKLSSSPRHDYGRHGFPHLAKTKGARYFVNGSSNPAQGDCMN